jgi:hypothetical protein
MRLSKILVAGGVLAGSFMLSAGVASAHHGGNGEGEGTWSECETEEEARDDCSPHWAPVGQNLLGDPDFPGRDGLPGGPRDDADTPGSGANAVEGITHNPNCPLHWRD